MGYRAWWLGGLLALLSCLPAQAAETFYETVVPISDRSDAARATALRQALGEVLVRLTGDRQAAAGGATAPLLDSADQYVQKYRYEGNERDGLRFRVGFDGPALEAALRRQGLSLWGRERPTVLLWLAVEDGQRRNLLGADSADPLYVAVQAAARAQGLTLVVPLLDLQDQAQVGFGDVWGGFQERVWAASARYRTPAVALARLQRHGESAWSGRWQVHLNGQTLPSWQAGGATVEAALRDGLAELGQQLAGHHRVAAPAAPQYPGALPLVIEGIEGLSDYAEIQAYLSQLAPVQSAHWVSAQDGRLGYRVEVQGGAEALERAIQLGGRLQRSDPAPITPGATGTPPALQYRWRR